MSKSLKFPLIISSAASLVALSACVLSLLVISRRATLGIVLLVFSVLLLGANIFLVIKYLQLSKGSKQENNGTEELTPSEKASLETTNEQKSADEIEIFNPEIHADDD